MLFILLVSATIVTVATQLLMNEPTPNAINFVREVPSYLQPYLSAFFSDEANQKRCEAHSYGPSCDTNELGRQHINSHDAYWKAGWQPVPMHTMSKAFVNDTSEASGAADEPLISPRSYSAQLPHGHRVFSLINRAADNATLRRSGEGMFSTNPASEATLGTHQEKWMGLCSAQTDKDWCFITIGCWGGNNPTTQRKVATSIDTVANKYVARDLLPRIGRDSLNMCDIRFGTLNGDNFYKKGIETHETTRMFTGVESVYNSALMLAIPWFASYGNHDYIGNWFEQVLLGNRAVANQWGNMKASDVWLPTMSLNTSLAGTSASAALRALAPNDVNPEWMKSFSTGRWYLPYPYYSARVSKEMVLINLDSLLFERCYTHGNDSPQCWDNGQQLGWLQSLLETLDRDPDVKYRILHAHYPMYGPGPHPNDKWMVQHVEPLMIKHGVQMYINAHNHYLQVSKKTLANGFGTGETSLDPAIGAPVTVDYYFVQSGGGGGYGENHYPQKPYLRENVFMESRNGPMFHCLRDVNTPDEQLVTIVYNDDAEKMFEFSVKPFVSPLALKTEETEKKSVRLH